MLATFRFPWVLGLLILSAIPLIPAAASSVLPLSDEAAWQEAEAVCLARLGATRTQRSAEGLVTTRLVVEVKEVLKGRLAETVTVTLRGGRAGDEGEQSGEWPSFRVGEERMLFLRRSALGLTLARGGDSLRPTAATPGVGSRLMAARSVARLRALRQNAPQAGVDLSALRADASDEGVDEGFSGLGGGTGGLGVDAAGIPARWLPGDRGEPIVYLVDAQSLPVGIAQADALTAIEQALAAWSAVTSLTFKFGGLQSFGQSAATVTTSDEKIRIQLHDLYGQLSAPSVLGLGGRGFTNGDGLFATTGGAGGQVAGQEFHRITRGYVVLQHSAVAMRTLSTFTEVLCHELGHVLGLGHSSDNPNEADALLNGAIMYYRAHADGRGAALGAYDPPVVQKAYPPTNTPPFTQPRALYLVTAPVTPNLPGVNEIRLLGCDRQSPEQALTLVAGTSTTGNPSLGAWSRTGTLVKFTPNAYYQDQLLDPAGNSFFARAFFRFSDGTHCSPWAAVRMLGFQGDSFPGAGGDGMPDEWMNEFFGSPYPDAGPRRGPNDDFDSDGTTNLAEFHDGSDPTDFRSGLNLGFTSGGDLTWSATPYEVYVIESSSDFASWSRFRNPVLTTGSSGSLPGVLSGESNRVFFRLRRQD